MKAKKLIRSRSVLAQLLMLNAQLDTMTRQQRAYNDRATKAVGVVDSITALHTRIESLSQQLAGYHARALKIDLSLQQLTKRIDYALTELQEQSAFLDKLTVLYPPPTGKK